MVMDLEQYFLKQSSYLRKNDFSLSLLSFDLIVYSKHLSTCAILMFILLYLIYIFKRLYIFMFSSETDLQ